MKKKILGIIVLILIVGAFIANHLISYARVAEIPLYVNLATTDLKNIGYGIGNPNPSVGGTSNQGEYIWNIRTYDAKDVTAISAAQRNLYCVKADYGQTWFTEQNEEEIIEYNLYYDIQEDREFLVANLKDNGTDADDIVKELLNPDGNQYRQLLWLFDNSYVPGQTNIDDYMAKVGILTEENGGQTLYYNKDTNQYYPNGNPLTEQDIMAIQKMAVWYFTNGFENDTYDKTEDSLWLNITTDGTNYNALKTVSESRDAMAMDLYKYLINSAQNGASLYTAENGYKLYSAPAEVDTTNLVKHNNKYEVETKRVDSNYLIGPIKINKNSDLGYDIDILVTDNNDNELETSKYSYTDKDGNLLSNVTSVKDLVGIQDGFYISVSRSLVESINIRVSISYKTTPKKLWLEGAETSNGIILNSEQPLVEVTQDPSEIVVELTSKLQEFDLALRKYITAVNGVTVANTRVPAIEQGTLLTGTTATYKHRKDPVVVQDKDEVTYNLTIYNEGNKAGYATKIVDQLPTGLVSSTNNTATVISKDKNGNEKNTYKLSYNSTLNQIILEIVETTNKQAKSLDGYIKGSLDYETIEIKCMVAKEPDTKEQIILTNVAWIASAYDSDEQIEILTQGQDRDSEPQTSPNVNKENMENYKGNDTNKSELADSSYFYKGKQDDDDFEKLVIMPVEKIFDLALFKHIAAISKDEIIENGEYVTDNGNIDGTYLRAPVVKAIDAETGKITYEQDDKAALTVEPGDYVLYTIRVYNEGEINGYASKIKDTLPIGLEFVVSNEEYNGKWNLDGLDADGRQVVTTTWYAKGNGDDEKLPGSNLLKALNKEGVISSENPDYIDAQVLCKVVEQATSNRVLVNYAQISDDTDENGEPIDDIDSTPDEWIDEEDDQDIERIQLQYFDLSLRKFITAINEEELKDSKGKYIREPVVDVSKLIGEIDTTAVYTHSKQPLAVKVGDKVIYTIRVYNEGSINGFASEVKDYLPPYLTYVENSEINTKYGWQLSEDGRIATTKYLANTELKAFAGSTLDYADLKIECIVSEEAPLKENQTNIAEISEYKYNGNIVERDIDSTANNIVSAEDLPSDEELPKYKNEEINNSYVPGNEDDDDFEKIYVKEFDLVLRKFITQIQEKEITTRVPQVETTPLKNGENTAIYTHPKDALIVHVGDIVIYTLRIYNEGQISGYASEITDDIPEYLEYLPEDLTNVEYMWKMYDEDGKETDNVEEAVKVKTTYLSKENGQENLIKAFAGETLSYKDIKIAFKVKDPNSNTYIITNHAQISNDTDENGNPVKDKDSIPDEWNENEDDQDIENVKVQYFDLSLLKFVSKVIVIENGKETITTTGYNGHENPEPVVKVELQKKSLSDVIVKFGYGITITNEGDIPGYATEITDYVPEGLKFVAEDNPSWTDEGNNVISTKQLENTLLQPGQSETIEVIFTWINDANNLSLKTNTAEISQDKNEYDVPDKDSTPDNKVDKEDDIDIAKVILTIKTGAVQTYFALTLGLLAVIAIGIVLIKKFVI